MIFEDRAEMDALLAAPDQQTSQARRDYALLLFLYNSGASADEVAQLTIRDLHLDSVFVSILGKGQKERQCPLWTATVGVLFHSSAIVSPRVGFS
jgi:integrase/recombinase XerD